MLTVSDSQVQMLENSVSVMIICAAGEKISYTNNKAKIKDQTYFYKIWKVPPYYHVCF